MNGIRDVKYSKAAAEGMDKINRLGTYLAGGLIIVLLFVSVFLVSNTVSLGVAVRKEEIEIMRYIGAANGFIKAPFRAEGVLIGLIGSVIPMAVIYVGYDQIIGWMTDKFRVITVFVDFVPVKNIMIYLVPVSLVIGIIIGLIGSAITIRKYLKA